MRLAVHVGVDGVAVVQGEGVGDGNGPACADDHGCLAGVRGAGAGGPRRPLYRPRGRTAWAHAINRAGDNCKGGGCGRRGAPAVPREVPVAAGWRRAGGTGPRPGAGSAPAG